jgi:hypothetical protein
MFLSASFSRVQKLTGQQCHCNKIVIKTVIGYNNVNIIKSCEFVSNPNEQMDNRHFNRMVFRRIAKYITKNSI